MSGTCSICSNCQSCESFCENSKQLVKLHKPSVTIDGGEILPDQIIIKRFTRADLNNIAKAIVEAGKKGSEQCSNDELELDPDACNECNTSCDTCVTCQHSSCHSSCHTSAPSGGGT